MKRGEAGWLSVEGEGRRERGRERERGKGREEKVCVCGVWCVFGEERREKRERFLHVRCCFSLCVLFVVVVVFFFLAFSVWLCVM